MLQQRIANRKKTWYASKKRYRKRTNNKSLMEHQARILNILHIIKNNRPNNLSHMNQFKVTQAFL